MSDRRVPAAVPLSFALFLAAALLACPRSHEPVARVTAPQRQLALPHGSLALLDLSWQPSRPLPEGAAPLVFMHLLDAQGNVARTFDHPFPGRWLAGSTVVDHVALYHSAIGPALTPGDYRLTVGLYDGKEKRFELAVEGEDVGRHEYVIAQVKAPGVSAGAPSVTFSPEWAAPEPTGDRQALARRWLTGDGSLEVAGVAPPARLWMLLSIPRPDSGLRMVLESGPPGGSVPTARISADCGGGFSADVAGEGFHELTVPILAAGPCKVTFDTNYSVVEVASGRKLSIDLEQLGWQLGGAAALPPASP